MSDPYENYVVFLSHFDGNNNDSITSDYNGMAISSYGVAPKLSTTQSKFGATSCAFIGTGSLTVSNGGFNFGNANLTIEGFVYPTGSGSPFLNCQTSTNLLTFVCGSSTSASLMVSSASVITGITLTANAWQHIAIVRNGNTWTVYVNGVSAGSGTNSSTIDCSVSGIGGSVVGGNYFNGYVDEIRITRGVARYTANFTPPSQAFDNVPLTKNYLLPDATILTCKPGEHSGFTVGKRMIVDLKSSPSYYDGGVFSITGYVLYNNIPASRRVCLFTAKDFRLIATVWSDPVTGVYTFTRLKEQPYFVWSDDYLQIFDPVSHPVPLDS